MLERGICQPSSSQWANPLHLVKKSNGEWRPCGDFRRLNAVTKPDKYSLPHIQDFTYHLAGCEIFSKIDLVKAYYQIPVENEDICKTAVITSFGLFEFTRMPFGLRNAAQTFQRFIDTVLRGLEFCHGYIDDLLIASKTEEEHRAHLEEVFKRLKKYRLFINVAKSQFGVRRIEYLGYVVDKEGIVNFYHRFIKDAASLLAPLNKYLVGAKKKDKRPIVWTPEADVAFEESKTRLAEVFTLVHPTEDAKILLRTDASNFAMGAVLDQLQDGYWRPLGFFSRKFSESQRNYSTYDRELLAIFAGLKLFRHLAEGRDVIILTDHKPLQYAFQQVADKASERQRRQLDFISQITIKIFYVNGEANEVADALSRLESISMPQIVTTDELYEEQVKDEELQALLQSETTLTLKKLRLDNVQGARRR
ncbi:hypothetical protein DMN91_007467 [Ooceraea biroi]|uniref:Reverse transcriptase domain-containing protein n=1 Tax=Ooceraea biroi TaxID=2015173 RepID=A0A3L8DKX9_OOCBI|nr:hypothetical protein DMN91_007467 [Ooceraea biroi]